MNNDGLSWIFCTSFRMTDPTLSPVQGDGVRIVDKKNNIDSTYSIIIPIVACSDLVH
jgi:hypothetical protein